MTNRNTARAAGLLALVSSVAAYSLLRGLMKRAVHFDVSPDEVQAMWDAERAS